KAIGMLRELMPEVEAIARVMIERLRAGGTIYTAGNGGSAAQALHLAEELIGRYRGNRGPLRAVCLNADPTALTCIANDFGFEEVFARQARALVTEKDVLVVLSTSGKSANILRVLDTAREKKCATVGLLGQDGGAAKALCDHAVIVPAKDSAQIQDAHQVVVHLLCEAIEVEFGG
ncbi:MAG TPA: SIS domain-containing protein, partial [Phycisphaerales bacterium]|nr:SIS domain-containing protein [Phycisphaerales bacterium]